MPGKKKYESRLTEQVLIRMTPDQMQMITDLKIQTGMNTAQILRDALAFYYDANFHASYLKQTAEPSRKG